MSFHHQTRPLYHPFQTHKFYGPYLVIFYLYLLIQQDFHLHWKTQPDQRLNRVSDFVMFFKFQVWMFEIDFQLYHIWHSKFKIWRFRRGQIHPRWCTSKNQLLTLKLQINLVFIKLKLFIRISIVYYCLLNWSTYT